MGYQVGHQKAIEGLLVSMQNTMDPSLFKYSLLVQWIIRQVPKLRPIVKHQARNSTIEAPKPLDREFISDYICDLKKSPVRLKQFRREYDMMQTQKERASAHFGKDLARKCALNVRNSRIRQEKDKEFFLETMLR